MRNVLIVIAALAAGGAGGWFANKYANKPVAVAPPAELLAQAAPVEADGPAEDRTLDSLDWLVGDWVDAGDDQSVEFSCHFTKNRAFLVRSFKVFEGDSLKLSGMQIIGWDESLQTVRSWTYDSDGGFGEEMWNQTGTRYTIRSTYNLPDGESGSSLGTLTYIDDDHFTWKSVNREIAGEFQPDVDEFLLVRKPVTDGPKKEGN